MIFLLGVEFWVDRAFFLLFQTVKEVIPLFLVIHGFIEKSVIYLYSFVHNFSCFLCGRDYLSLPQQKVTYVDLVPGGFFPPAIKGVFFYICPKYNIFITCALRATRLLPFLQFLKAFVLRGE